MDDWYLEAVLDVSYCTWEYLTYSQDSPDNACSVWPYVGLALNVATGSELMEGSDFFFQPI